MILVPNPVNNYRKLSKKTALRDAWDVWVGGSSHHHIY